MEGLRQEVLHHIYKMRHQKKFAEKKFADLLDIAVTNMKEAKLEDEMGNGLLYRKLLRKLPGRIVAQYIVR